MKLYTITFQKPLSISMQENSQIIQDTRKSDVRISTRKVTSRVGRKREIRIM